MTDRDIINIASPPRRLPHRRALAFALIVAGMSAAVMLLASVLA